MLLAWISEEGDNGEPTGVEFLIRVEHISSLALKIPDKGPASLVITLSNGESIRAANAIDTVTDFTTKGGFGDDTENFRTYVQDTVRRQLIDAGADVEG